jgi:hypothetical protein
MAFITDLILLGIVLMLLLIVILYNGSSHRLEQLKREKLGVMERQLKLSKYALHMYVMKDKDLRLIGEIHPGHEQLLHVITVV